MRYIFLTLLILCASILTACSYSTEFVVINESRQPIEVRYKVKNFPGQFGPPETLATIPASQLNTHGDIKWKILNSDQIQIDETNRTVTTRLMPREVLRIARMRNYGGHENSWDAKEFPIEGIDISGINGQIKLTGEQARITFSEMSRALYTLTYK